VLLSAGSDGSLHVWRVDPSARVFESIASYSVGSAQGLAPDITCFDFVRSSPLLPASDKAPHDVFVVG
ncbi:jg3744, partial [Pararge aegeria aegeria]